MIRTIIEFIYSEIIKNGRAIKFQMNRKSFNYQLINDLKIIVQTLFNFHSRIYFRFNRRITESSFIILIFCFKLC